MAEPAGDGCVVEVAVMETACLGAEQRWELVEEVR